MIIREATDRDLPAINTIYNQAVRQRFCTAHLDELDMAYTHLNRLRQAADELSRIIMDDEKART